MPNEWQTVMDEIKTNVSDMAYNTYFKNFKYVSNENGIVTIAVQNSFVKVSIERKYRDEIIKALRTAGVEANDIQLIEDSTPIKSVVRRGIEVLPGIKDKPKETPRVSSFNTSSSSPKNNPNYTGLNPKYRLDNYVVGSNNDAAVSAAQSVIDFPGERYNPLFIYGGAGLGKTHLIQAIGNEIRVRHPELKVLYITIEEFYHSFVTAMKNRLDDFGERYRNVDVLIVDDFQFIAGKQGSQDEFFHTFNVLHKANKQIIVTSDKLPSEIAKVDTRLSSRLTMGVSIDIQMPDFETRCAILKAKADILGQPIDNSTVEYLAEHINTNVRDLEGELNKVLLYSELRGLSTSEVLNEIGSSIQPQKHHLSAKQLVEKVAKYYNLSSKDLYGTSRIKDIKNARQVAMYLMNEELGLSTVKIGNEFNKDHTTIMHGIKVVRENQKKDFALREQISEIRGRLYAN